MTFLRWFLPVVFLVCSSQPVFAELSAAQIAKDYSPSVVTIVALDKNDQPLSLGSGFFIDTAGLLVTNHHVLEGSVKALVKTGGGARGEILEIVQDDPDLDLLIARTNLQNTKPLPVGDSDLVTVGEDIVAVGNPAGLEGTISKGIISGVRKGKSLTLIQITAPISPGSSGGPVFNLHGKVVGVATAYLDRGQNLNFALPVNYLRDLKPSHVKLYALPKVASKGEFQEKEAGLVQVVESHFDFYSYDGLSSVVFSLKNRSDYRISNIKILFVYKNSQGEMIDYSQIDYSPETETGNKEIDARTKKTFEQYAIPPRMAKQFNHKHSVAHFRGGTVEIRILDYKLDRASGSSPADLLFR